MADQQEPSGFFRSITPTVWVSIFTALLSVGGVLTVSLITASAQRTLEREQFESNLILKAISGGDKKQNYDNLRFLIEAHLIRRESDKIRQLLQDTSFHFHLPSEKTVVQSPLELTQSDISRIRAAQAYPGLAFSGTVVDKATSKPITGATVSIKTRRSEMRNVEAVVTGTDGRFTLHYPHRNYTLSYQCPGYVEENTWHFAAMKFTEPLVLRMVRIN